MKCQRIHLRSCLFLASVLFCPTLGKSQNQSAISPTIAPQGIILSKLFTVTYPPLARQARISGEVKLTLQVRKDGSVALAVPVNGHPLLIQAAIDSAQKSQFECTECKEEMNLVELVYSFDLAVSPHPCESTENPSGQNTTLGNTVPRVVQIQNHVSVVDHPAYICDPPGEIKKRSRSIRCLYLWRCAKLIPVC